MSHPDSSRTPVPNDPDLARVTEEIGSRLRARGVTVSDRDSSEGLVRVLEAVEAFERAVESRGGDLMMDEPPPHSTPQPDDVHFLLPTRAADETLAQFTDRIWAAAAAVRAHRRRR